jgi:hypothetical protein
MKPMRITTWLGALLCIGLFTASPASAAFEQVGCFAGSFPGLTDSCKPVEEEKFGEEVELGGASGLAVNYTGAGGVSAGTVYSVSAISGQQLRVVMFTPLPDGGLKFELGWEVTLYETETYSRCGPALGEVGGKAKFPCSPRPAGGFGWDISVDVDQATGNVYVYNNTFGFPGKPPKRVVVYSPKGTEVISRFGQSAQPGEIKDLAEDPERLTGGSITPGMAVGSSGTVYVAVNPGSVEGHSRVMVFEPQSPGDYAHYVYVGDVLPGPYIERIALDDSGNIYMENEVGPIQMFSPQTPEPYSSATRPPPICSLKKNSIYGFAVNPIKGEVFYYSFKQPKRIFQLAPCDPQTETFEQIGQIGFEPPRDDFFNLAVDPQRKPFPSRPAGVLYATAPNRGPSSGVGEGQPGQSSLGYVFAPSEEHPPTVESESVSHVTPTTALLGATLNPNGFSTTYRFQYLTEAAYQANEPDELQRLTVSADAGLFGLDFEGVGIGAPAVADLSAGSAAATGLATATGTADLTTAKGTATFKRQVAKGTANGTKGSAALTAVTTAVGAGLLSAATGTGDLSTGSKVVEGLSTKTGDFAVGQEVAAAGVPAGTTIAALGAGTLELSAPATADGDDVALQAASRKVTSLNTTVGEFLPGQTVAGAHVPPGTTITAVTASSLTLSSLPTSSGAESLLAGSQPFEKGQFVTGPGVAAETTVTAVGPRTLQLSKPLTENGNAIEIEATSPVLTNVNTSEGSFEVGMVVGGKEAEGIPVGATITDVKPSQLTLSRPVLHDGTGVEFSAGSRILSSFTPGIGTFKVGQLIKGDGIPSGTEITAVGSDSLTVSEPVTKAGTAVALSSPDPRPLHVGDFLEGPGIAPGTTIAALDSSGHLTLSVPATASGTGVALETGLPATVGAPTVRRALERLSTIGAHGVKVTGGPGDSAGSSPYSITFTGRNENADVDELVPSDISLSGGPSSAIVQTLNDGGQGFSQGAVEAPLGGALLPESQGAQNAAAPFAALSPQTRYRFRVIATSNCGESGKVCETAGEAMAFQTLPLEAPGLPDDRAYELVSPANKGLGEVSSAQPGRSSCIEIVCKPGINGLGFPRQSAPGGGAVAYEGSSFAVGQGDAIANAYVATRDPDAGWQTTSLTPSVGIDVHAAYSASLERALFSHSGPTLDPLAPEGFANLYDQSTSDPLDLAPLLTTTGARPEGALQIRYGGASADLSRVFFEANDALPVSGSVQPLDGGASKFNLYEWQRQSGELHLVNIAPDNATTEPGATFGNAGAHAISEDGSRAFWSDATGQLYVREGAEATKAIPGSGPGAKFLAAATDGSNVLLDNGLLYDLNDEASTDLTEGKGGFLGLAGQSDDLTHLYFVDAAVLTGEEENEYGDKAQAGKPNLYAWDGSGAEYVTTLLAEDQEAAEFLVRGWDASPILRTSQASPNGRYLAFVSKSQLTGVNNIGPCAFIPASSQRIPAPCASVFLYDSDLGRLTCPSCNPSGAAPIGRSLLPVVDGQPNLDQARFLSDSGRLFFDSMDSLSPADTNENHEDVYQWEPDGVGNCERPAGCLSLISGGTAADDSNFLATDPSGDNVFFTTRDRLLTSDRDELVDLYDARAHGGIPAATEGAPLPCQGEACQPQSQPPEESTPASSSYRGSDNVDEPSAKSKRCKKGFGRKGRCAKEHRRHKTRSQHRRAHR